MTTWAGPLIRQPSTTCPCSMPLGPAWTTTCSTFRSRGSTPALSLCVPCVSAEPLFEHDSNGWKQIEPKRALGRKPGGVDDLPVIDPDLGTLLQLEREDLDMIALALPILDLVED